jgi:AcrR family transcriptional regulator
VSNVGTGNSKQGRQRANQTKATRAALLRAARNVLRKSGYANATVAEIAKSARRAHGTFYLYFPNKEAVYAVLLDDMWEDLKAQGRAIWKADEPMLSVAATIQRFVSSYEENLDLWKLAEDMSATNPRFRELRIEHHRLLARKIRRGIEGAGPASRVEGLDLEVLSSILAGMLEAACRANFGEGPKVSVDLLADHLATVWGRALGYITVDQPSDPAPALAGS